MLVAHTQAGLRPCGKTETEVQNIRKQTWASRGLSEIAESVVNLKLK